MHYKCRQSSKSKRREKTETKENLSNRRAFVAIKDAAGWLYRNWKGAVVDPRHDAIVCERLTTIWE